MLPGILAQLIVAIISGKAVGKYGFYLPWSVAGAVLAAVGYGLLSTLGPHTSTGKWIGYQILFGAGRGCGLQMPLVAVQNTLAPSQIPTATSLVIFAQNFGGALFLSFADTILTNSLRSLIPQDAPGVDPQTIVNAGAYGFRHAVPKQSVAGVLRAYSKSIDHVFYMCVGLAGLCFVASWGTGWVDIRQKKKPAAQKVADGV